MGTASLAELTLGGASSSLLGQGFSAHAKGHHGGLGATTLRTEARRAMDRLARPTAHRLVSLTVAVAPMRASGTIADAVANVCATYCLGRDVPSTLERAPVGRSWAPSR